MKQTLDHGDMVANIVLRYDAASDAQRQEGEGWYIAAGAIVKSIANETGVHRSRIAYALAALSPRNPWRWNVADCYAFALARAEGRTMPSATTYKRNRQTAWQALGQDGSPWLSAAPKVHHFVDAILGDLRAVAVDTWAMRVATGGALSLVTNRQYPLVVAAYTEAAALRGIWPADMQAITWLVARSEGPAARKSRHNLTFKTGTPEFIRAALSEGAIK